MSEVMCLYVTLILCALALRSYGFQLASSLQASRTTAAHDLFMSSGSMKRKLALVTGSTGGIGLGIARALAKEGSDLVINGFGSESEIHAIITSLQREFNVQVSYNGADLSKADGIEAMMSEILKIRPVDILVNNAGIQHVAPVDEFPVDKWNLLMSVNLGSVFHTTRLALPAMKKQNWGRIINIASTHGLVASANKAPYVASKHAVVGFTKAVALETAQTKVTANCVCPGWVLTSLVQKQIEDRAASLGISIEESRVRLISEKQPSGNAITVEQLASLVVFLASEAAAEVRGAAWNMDGGWVAQ